MAVERMVHDVELTDVSQVAGGGYHSLFVKTDGTLWTTGANWYGQLGDGTSIFHSTPVQVATDVSHVFSGTQHSIFLQSPNPLDSDNDGLQDSLEENGCTNSLDADTDDDGIPDGTEDADHNGVVDTGETDPCKSDTVRRELWRIGYSCQCLYSRRKPCHHNRPIG